MPAVVSPPAGEKANSWAWASCPPQPRGRRRKPKSLEFAREGYLGNLSPSTPALKGGDEIGLAVRMRKKNLQQKQAPTRFPHFFAGNFIPTPGSPLTIRPIALAGTGCAPGVRESGGNLPLQGTVPGGMLRARDRPAVPGCRVRDCISEKRMLGERQHRGNRGEAARVFPSARQRPPPSLGAAGTEEEPE